MLLWQVAGWRVSVRGSQWWPSLTKIGGRTTPGSYIPRRPILPMPKTLLGLKFDVAGIGSGAVIAQDDFIVGDDEPG